MRCARLVLAGAIALAFATPAAAQRGMGRPSDPDRDAPKGMSSAGFSMPTVNVVKERANVAELLLDKRKKLEIDAAGADSLKALSATIDARNAPAIATYDTLRIRIRAAAINGGSGPDPEARARGQRLAETIGTLRASHQADADKALAFVPEAKRAEARKMIQDQDEDLQKAAGGRGGRGPGGTGGQPPRP